MAGKDRAEQYLVRTPDGTDYDHDASFEKCRRQADALGRGATVHPLRPGTMDVVTTPGGKEVVRYTAK
jgi:hypothetical protein